MLTSLLLLSALRTISVTFASPTVSIDSAVLTGITVDSNDKFLGIPYGLPPLGDLRFRKPVLHPTYQGNISATVYGPSCIRQAVFPPPKLAAGLSSLIVGSRILHTMAASESEDCLSLNVIRPSMTYTTDLPVVVWIYGGGFEIGDTVSHDSMGMRVVQRSVALSSPVIYVSMNYRLSAYGFLASKEVMEDNEGNMGLLDQRLALKWVQKYIGQFGGDKSRVLLWGQSAGAISASLQMLAYGGTTNDLFHAAFMMSGAPISVGSLTRGQKYYDFIVEKTGCNLATKTLDCLRRIPISVLKAAVDKTPSFFSYQSLVLAWLPRVDGIFLQDNPQKLVQQGKIASIPFVSGNCDDEGTLFSLSTLNITSEADFREYISRIYVPDATASELEPLWSNYLSDLPDGSPFDTGYLNGLTPQFKRLAAFQGDVVFQASKRFFLGQTSGTMKVWSYLSKRQKYIPFAGSYHGSDLDLDLWDDFVVRMAVSHDPNSNGTMPLWPQYTPQFPLLYTVSSNVLTANAITEDTYRGKQFHYLTNLSLAHPL